MGRGRPAPAFVKNPKWQLEQQITEDQLLDCRHQDDDLGAEEDERPVPASVALDEFDIRLVGKLDAEPFCDGLGEIA